MAAAGGLVNALKAMGGFISDRAIADYMAQGGAPKSARLATPEQLRQAGMLE